MTSKIQNISIDQGTDYRQTFIVLDRFGSPVNLSGASAAMQIRPYYDGAAVVTLTTADGTLTIDGPAGAITAVIDDHETGALLSGVYLYDIKVLDSAGAHSRPFQGSVTVTDEVTTYELEPAGTPALLYHGGGYLIQRGGGKILLRA